MPEEAYESGGEESIAEGQGQEHDSDNSEEIMKEGYQERHLDDEKAKPKAKSRLEKKLGKLRTVSREQNIKEFYDGGNIDEFIQDREITPEEMEMLEEQFKEAKYFPVGLNSIDGYVNYWRSQDKASLRDGIKGLWYLVKGFIDVEGGEDRDAYEKIANMKHSPIIYISGALEYPMSIREMEEVSGYKLAHFKERKDPDKLNELIEYTIRATGQKPILMAFSDGGKSAQNWADKYSTDNVSMIYAIAASKFDIEDSDKLKFIDGKKDRIFILEKDAFKKTDSEVFKVPGGHTWTCYDPVTIQQIFSIIEGTARAERANFERFDTKKAA